MELAAVEQQQIESTEGGAVLHDSRGILRGRGAVGQEVCDQRAARPKRTRSLRIANVRDRGEAAALVDGEPSPACREIAAAQHLRRVRPPCGGQRRPRVLLVAIGGDEQRMARGRADPNDDQAHLDMLPGCGERRGSTLLEQRARGARRRWQRQDVVDVADRARVAARDA
jgi:hypothetical protein